MIQTLISVAPKVAPIVYKMIEADQNHWYGNQFITDYGVIRTLHFKAFDYEDEFLVVERIDDERSHWYIKNFDAETKVWDGTSFLPDGGCKSLHALLKASLFHDVTYERMKAISEKTGVPIEKLQAFADDMLKILADGYGAKKSVTSPIHWLVRTGGMLYHKLKGIVGLLLLLGALTCGCYTIRTEMESPPPEIYPTEPYYGQDSSRTLFNNFLMGNDETYVQTPPSASTPLLSDSRMVLH